MRFRRRQGDTTATCECYVHVPCNSEGMMKWGKVGINWKLCIETCMFLSCLKFTSQG